MRTLCTCLLVVGAALSAPAGAAAASASLPATALPLAGSATRHTQRFDLVGLHWRGPGSVRFSTHALGGGWSAWHAAAPEADDLPDPGTAERAAAGGGGVGRPLWGAPPWGGGGWAPPSGPASPMASATASRAASLACAPTSC